jgi:hypothetical protein
MESGAMTPSLTSAAFSRRIPGIPAASDIAAKFEFLELLHNFCLPRLAFDRRSYAT